MSHRSEEVELEISVRRLREQFHGKIPIDKAAVLMRRYWNNYTMVTKEIILMKDRDLDKEDKWFLENDPVVKNVVEKLQKEEKEKERRKRAAAAARRDSGGPSAANTNTPQEDRDIQDLVQQLRVLPLTEKNKRMFDQAQQNLMPSFDHQFACQTCDISWWRRVPKRKRVSRCRRCKRKYDPVPADRMWGIAEFFCARCSRSFKGFGCMTLGSPCYGCRMAVHPTQILPPRKSIVDRGRRRNTHSCLAADCFNRQEPHVPGTECVHPISRKRNGKPAVVNPSERHISSGSTVNTCLSQGSLIEDLCDLILDDIDEEHSDDSATHSSASSGQ